MTLFKPFHFPSRIFLPASPPSLTQPHKPFSHTRDFSFLQRHMNQTMKFNETTTKFEQSTAPGYITTFVERSRSPNLPNIPNYPDYSISSSFSSFSPSPIVPGQPHTYDIAPFAQSGHPQDDMGHSDESAEQYRESPPLEPELQYMESIALFDKAVIPMDGIADSVLDSFPFVSSAVHFVTDDDGPSQQTEALTRPLHLVPGPKHAKILDSSDPIRTTKRAKVDEWGDKFVRPGKRQRQDIKATTTIDCPPQKVPFRLKICGRLECGSRTSIG